MINEEWGMLNREGIMCKKTIHQIIMEVIGQLIISEHPTQMCTLLDGSCHCPIH